MNFKNGIVALWLGLALCAPQIVWAEDEGSAFIEFQRLARESDPQQLLQAAKRDQPVRPSRADVDKSVGKVVLAALVVMDRAGEFESRFPQSGRLTEVRRAVLETLGTVFGIKGLPVPPERVADVEAYVRALMRENPTDFRPPMILCRVAAAQPVEKRSKLYAELSLETTPEPARTMAREALQKLDRVGMILDLSFTALDGSKVVLTELKGKVVLIDFWSTTCLPCIQELPGLKKLYGQYKDRGLEIIGISLDSDKAVLEQFIEKEQIPWPQYYDPAGEANPIARKYGINSIPVVWLVDKQGVLRELNGRENLEEKVKGLLKGL
jgi:peroxiredoxin